MRYPASVVDPGTVVSAVQAAYGAYQKLSGGQLTLAAATNQIINAIDTAKEAIIDHVGYALNVVVPIALLARKHANLGTAALKTTIVSATNSLIARLATSCSASPLWGDAEPGAPVEVMLRCTAFNGRVGTDSVIVNIRPGDPLPPFNYSRAKTLAMRGTSYELAVAALPILNQA